MDRKKQQKSNLLPGWSGFSRRQLESLGLIVCSATFLLSTGCQWTANGKNALGAQLHQQGQYTAALQQFQQAVASDPTNPDGY